MAVKDTQAEKTNAWDEEVEILVPRRKSGEDAENYFVSVNNRNFFIPKNGKMQKLPRPIYEILKDSLEAEAAVDDFIDSMPNASAPRNF